MVHSEKVFIDMPHNTVMVAQLTVVELDHIKPKKLSHQPELNDLPDNLLEMCAEFWVDASEIGLHNHFWPFC